MKWFLWIAGSLAAVVVLIAIIGSLLPKKHNASRTARYHQPPEAVWQAITDFAGAAAWRTDVKSVERMPDQNGHQVWREIDKQGQAIPFETAESIPPRRLVRRIADPNLPFGGRWIYELAPAEGGCTLTITEDGEIYNPIFRFVARFFIGYTGTMENYLKALGKKFGEEVTL